MIAFFIFVDFVALNCTFSPPRPVTLKCAEIRKLYSLDVIKWCGVVAASSGPAAGWALYWATGNEIPYLSSSEQQQSWSRQFVAVL